MSTCATGDDDLADVRAGPEEAESRDNIFKGEDCHGRNRFDVSLRDQIHDFSE
jgi:hypothetical protein